MCQQTYQGLLMITHYQNFQHLPTFLHTKSEENRASSLSHVKPYHFDDGRPCRGAERHHSLSILYNN